MKSREGQHHLVPQRPFSPLWDHPRPTWAGMGEVQPPMMSLTVGSTKEPTRWVHRELSTLLTKGQEEMRVPVRLPHCCRAERPTTTSSQQACWYSPKLTKGRGEPHEQNVVQGEADNILVNDDKNAKFFRFVRLSPRVAAIMLRNDACCTLDLCVLGAPTLAHTKLNSGVFSLPIGSPPLKAQGRAYTLIRKHGHHASPRRGAQKVKKKLHMKLHRVLRCSFAQSRDRVWERVPTRLHCSPRLHQPPAELLLGTLWALAPHTHMEASQ
jgi:hypothetical protein